MSFRTPKQSQRQSGARRTRLTAPASDNRLRGVFDSGMLSNTNQAQHTKPIGWLSKVQGWWSRTMSSTRAAKTTEQGSAAASPSAYSFELYSLRYERRAVIDECRQMFNDDLRCRKAVSMYVGEAVRKGVIITVDMPGRGPMRKRMLQVQEICETVERIINNKDEGSPKVLSWGQMALVEGDLFIQIVADLEKKTIVNAKRMPAASMERNSDDTDEFQDPTAAYSNVDVMTNSEIATFPEVLIWHGRWAHIEGEKYGTPEIIACRRPRRLLEMGEEALVRQRLSRASQHRLWNIGTPDKPGEPSDVETFKERNGMVEGLVEQYDPVNVGMDFYGNGLISCDILEGDANIDKIEDIDHFSNFYTAGLPTPAALYNLSSKDINRDILEDQRSQWLLSTHTLTDFLKGCVCRIIDVGLMLQGIAPETVTYTVHFSESSIETPNDIIDRALKLFNNGHGAGKVFVWKPLITWKRCIQMVAEYMDVDDVDAEYDLIQTMLADEQNGQEMLARAQGLVQPGPQPVNKNGAEPIRMDGRNGVMPNGNGNGNGITNKGTTVGTGTGKVKTPAGAYVGVGTPESPYSSSYGAPTQQPEY